MKLGMTSLTLGKLEPELVAEYAAKASLNGIEWGVSDLHMPLLSRTHADKIKKASEKFGLEIFSLGSYCEMKDRDECIDTVKTADMLGAGVIRVWAGNTGSAHTSDEDYALIVENTQFMVKEAAKLGIKIGFEYHHGTLTDTAEGAVRLAEDTGAGLYWQPAGEKSAEENIAEFGVVKPYSCGMLHVQNYTPENGYGMLSEIRGNLVKYYDSIREEDFKLLIEFVKDGDPDNLIRDARVLGEIVQKK